MARARFRHVAAVMTTLGVRPQRTVRSILVALLAALVSTGGCLRDPEGGHSAAPVQGPVEGAPPPSPPEPDPVELDEPAFHWGVTTRGEAASVAVAGALGCTSVRFDIPWNGVEPVISNPALKKSDITQGMIDAYAFKDPTKKWGETDLAMKACAQKNLRPIVIIGNGFTGHLPEYKDSSGQTKRFTPDAGHENYLACLYLFAAAAAKRYGKQVRHWQLDNELNAAGWTVAWGWRHGLKWLDWNFLTEVLKTLHEAVKGQDPTAVASVNFHTGVVEWPAHLQAWKDEVDLVAIDAYPNYVIGWPVMGDVVGWNVGLAKWIAPDKRVIVFETGYPTAPSAQGFGEDGQVQYMNQAAKAIKDHGGEGLIWFALKTSEQPSTGGVNWPLSILGNVEGYWGLLRADGTPKKAFQTFQALAAP